MTAEEIRAMLGENEPEMLEFMDMARDRWGAKLIGIAVLKDGRWRGMGMLRPSHVEQP